MYRRAYALYLRALLANAPAGAAEPSIAQWRGDLRFLFERIVETHPAPFFRTSEVEFRAEVAKLDREIPDLDRRQIVTRLMQIAALVQDGHTSVYPSGAQGLRTWFPIRFRAFPEGVYVTNVVRDHAELVGARVVRLGRLPGEEALARVATLEAGDNDFWKRATAPLYLSNGDALAALGVLDEPGQLTLTAELATGATVEVELSGVDAEFGDGWYWRVLRAPGGDTVGPFESAEPPLHLREQVSGGAVYWFELLPEAGILYFQLNGWWDRGELSFAEFRSRLWRAFDTPGIDTLVFDLRYNAGGNGALFNELLIEIIRRPELYEPGRLVVLTGGRTFSASINSIGKLLELANIAMIGTPMGAGLNGYGDNLEFELPASGLRLYVSKLFWQNGFPDDRRSVVSPHVPAPMTAADFFAGRDPALELVLSDDAISLADRIRRDGARVAIARHRRLRAAHPDLHWWVPFAERELNRLGYELAEAGRSEDSRLTFLLNAETYPDAWNVWDSLGESYLATGELEEAERAYLRSIELNPGSSSGKRALEQIAESLRAESP